LCSPPRRSAATTKILQFLTDQIMWFSYKFQLSEQVSVTNSSNSAKYQKFLNPMWALHSLFWPRQHFLDRSDSPYEKTYYAGLMMLAIQKHVRCKICCIILEIKKIFPFQDGHR
jgi:hypothetical protein